MATFVAVVALYGAGLTSSLSPCVLPLVPAYVGALGPVPGATRVVRVGLFAAGASASFVLLGAIVGSLGWSVSATGTWLQRVAGSLIIGFGLMLLAVRLGRLRTEVRLITHLPRQPHLMALALGVGCGAAWTPCVGPLLGAALTAAGSSGSPARGSLLLFGFAIGVLTPFVALAMLGVPRLPESIRRLGNVASWASAVVLVVLGTLMVGGWYDALVQRLPSGT